MREWIEIVFFAMQFLLLDLRLFPPVSMKMWTPMSCVFVSSLMPPSFQYTLTLVSPLILSQCLAQQVYLLLLLILANIWSHHNVTYSDSSDYDEFTSFNNPLVAFTSDPSTHRQCFNVTIIDDDAVEISERFNLSLNLAGGFNIPVIVDPDTSEVEIIDNDG